MGTRYFKNNDIFCWPFLLISILFGFWFFSTSDSLYYKERGVSHTLPWCYGSSNMQIKVIFHWTRPRWHWFQFQVDLKIVLFKILQNKNKTFLTKTLPWISGTKFFIPNNILFFIFFY